MPQKYKEYMNDEPWKRKKVRFMWNSKAPMPSFAHYNSHQHNIFPLASLL